MKEREMLSQWGNSQDGFYHKLTDPGSIKLGNQIRFTNKRPFDFFLISNIVKFGEAKLIKGKTINFNIFDSQREVLDEINRNKDSDCFERLSQDNFIPTNCIRVIGLVFVYTVKGNDELSKWALEKGLIVGGKIKFAFEFDWNSQESSLKIIDFIERDNPTIYGYKNQKWYLRAKEGDTINDFVENYNESKFPDFKEVNDLH